LTNVLGQKKSIFHNDDVNMLTFFFVFVVFKASGITSSDLFCQTSETDFLYNNIMYNGLDSLDLPTLQNRYKIVTCKQIVRNAGFYWLSLHLHFVCRNRNNKCSPAHDILIFFTSIPIYFIFKSIANIRHIFNYNFTEIHFIVLRKINWKP
jgi:hypothetical protein